MKNKLYKDIMSKEKWTTILQETIEKVEHWVECENGLNESDFDEVDMMALPAPDSPKKVKIMS